MKTLSQFYEENNCTPEERIKIKRFLLAFRLEAHIVELNQIYKILKLLCG